MRLVSAFPLSFLLAVSTLAAATADASAAQAIAEILDADGAGGGRVLTRPVGVALDHAGNVYVAGRDSNNAFKIAPDGTVVELVDGSGDGLGNTLDGSHGIAVDRAGNVFVSGRLSDNVLRITPEGVVTEILDASGDGLGNVLDRPEDVVTDSLGNVFVVGALSDNAFKVAPDGTIVEIIDVTGDGQGNRVHIPTHLAVDAADNVYVSGGGSNVFRIAPDGTIVEIIDGTGDGTHLLHAAGGVAVDADGNVFVAGVLSDNAFKIAPDGTITQIVDRSGDGVSLFDTPIGVGVDSAGNVYFACAGYDNVFKVTPEGAVGTILGPSGDGSGNPLDFPYDLDVLAPDTVYVSGHFSHNVFRIGTGSFSFCDGADGSLAACPCANAGEDATGCELPQATGGVELRILAQESTPANRATLSGAGFHPGGKPFVVALRAVARDPAAPFGDGVRCVRAPLARVHVERAIGGTSIHEVSHDASDGVYYYQLWFRSTPITYCDAAAAFNFSSGRALIW